MPDFYDSMAATASRLLAEFGQSVTFTHPVTSSFDPVTGIETPGTPVSIPGYGAAFDYMHTEIDGTIIQKGDIRFLFESTTVAPVIGDTVTIDSVVYRVMDSKPTKPAGTTVLQELQLRK